MKIIRFISYVFITVLMVSLVSGCKKTVPAPADNFPKSTPGAKLLESSDLWQFAKKLRSLPAGARDAVVQQFIKRHPVTPVIEVDSLAGFYWYGNAKKVVINGDIQHSWTMPDSLDEISCGENSFFFKIYQLPADARLDYLLYIDGKETTDPRNPRITPSGFGPHSEIAMPLFKSNPVMVYREDVEHGTINSIVVAGKDTSIASRIIKIYKPAGYESLSKLPVLYIHDGMEALQFLSYANVLDNLIADKKIQPVLVIFIEMQSNDLALFAELESFICDELVPRIDASYKTDAIPSKRAIAGISIFGDLALSTVFNRPGTFLMAAGQSTTIMKQLINDFIAASENWKAVGEYKIYMDVGKYDKSNGAMDNLGFLQANEFFQQKLKQNTLRHTYHVYNDGHQWANWRERTNDILEYFFPCNN